ncbi:hypothetical protein RGUI_1045 [Rhodovulum sp. P5]|uniref:DUF4169 family protein n=1 Tax=Rhodovulum sp. P5 TaxID=1564506 RepID=UPI0009C25081|nr:DUF4169 family protein [Rhodovulum sp. P5]ARE39186.1 hypothetical protein RGUI_1045 [Rhodovulum sp. P5]
MTGKVVNLRQARKARQRADQRAKGDEKAAKFGRTKAQRAKEEADAIRARDHLDAHKREDE